MKLFENCFVSYNFAQVIFITLKLNAASDEDNVTDRLILILLLIMLEKHSIK